MRLPNAQRVWLVLRVLFGLSLCGALGCAELPAGGVRLEALRRSIEAVTRAGAYGCAPRELALGRAHFEFAQMELAQGDPVRAAEHFDEAEENMGAAEMQSPRERCERSAGPAPDLSSNAPQDSDGDRVADVNDRCPNEREDWDANLDADGCIDLDDDSDKIPDTRDQCPQQPEDLDGNADEDGCPDPDNDSDGVSDVSDACPDTSGPSEQGGCPKKDYPNLTVTERELRLAESIQFAANSATIRSVSFALLDTVAQLLRDQPRMTLEIGGHTDSQGDDAQNLLSSQEQAVSIRNYLIEHGVDPARLTARGYGETRPIESNSTSQGRAINRRIELVRTDRAP